MKFPDNFHHQKEENKAIGLSPNTITTFMAIGKHRIVVGDAVVCGAVTTKETKKKGVDLSIRSPTVAK